jgi:hypothetical protein
MTGEKAVSVGEPLNPCPKCGEHINDDILRTSPECPHGWGPAEPGDLAEIFLEAWSNGDA